MIKTFIIKGIIWNSLLIICFGDNDYHARFIQNIFANKYKQIVIISNIYSQKELFFVGGTRRFSFFLYIWKL
jgi:hypothetical protein